MGQPRPLFGLFSFFSNTNFTVKTVGIIGIWIRIVRVEGEHSDHLITTTATIFGTAIYIKKGFPEPTYLVVPELCLDEWPQTFGEFHWRLLFLIMGHPLTLFRLFLSFQTIITIFTTKKCEKLSIQYIFRNILTFIFRRAKLHPEVKIWLPEIKVPSQARTCSWPRTGTTSSTSEAFRYNKEKTCRESNSEKWILVWVSTISMITVIRVNVLSI